MQTKLTLFLLTFLLSFTSYAQYVTVDKNGNLITSSASGIGSSYGGTFDEEAFKQFDAYAKFTNGQMGFCPQFDHLPKVLDGLLQKIFSDQKIKQDVVLALDTTGSMADEINAVKKSLKDLIEKLSGSESKDIQVSIILYKDMNQTDPYVAKILNDLESDLQLVQQNLKTIQVSGGGDQPEAVLDALELIESEVKFRLNSNKTVVLIGDARGHERSKLTNSSTQEVLELFVIPGESISINPILVSNLAPSSVTIHKPTCGFGPCF